jgi:RimJ/RimL family protein N-acetyltransferase
VAFPDRFTTERLRAERLTAAHLIELRALHRDGEVMARIGGPRTEAQTAQYLAENLRHWSEHGFGLWILRERDREPVAGLAMLRRLSLDGRVELELGYALYPSLWGRGLATEVAAACVAHAREDLHTESVVALVEPGHVRSERVLEKAGLQYEREVTVEGTRRSLFRRRFDAEGAPG